MSDPSRDPARSFGTVAEAYDRARPSYPVEAVDWLLGASGGDRLRVLELGAGTGKFSELLAAAGHQLIATDPSPEMLGLLGVRVRNAETFVATAQHLPLPARSVDVVIAAQSFHWFATDEALREIARVLRPGGTLGIVWNVRDTAIPWVRKLDALVEHLPNRTETVEILRDCAYFGEVSEQEYRYWQHLRRDELFDLVRSRSNVAVLDEHARNDLLAKVGALYDDYGRGHDGMKLPYLTRCFRATLVGHPPEPVVLDDVVSDAVGVVDVVEDDGTPEARTPDGPAPAQRPAHLGATLPPARQDPDGNEDTATVLIDFS